jgi:thiol-disulfide isomerase/thioredoxin
VPEKNTVPLKILYFSAPWCGPCRAFGPRLEEFVKERPELVLVKIDVETEQGLADAYNVGSVPTLVVLPKKVASAEATKAQVLGRATGALSRAELVDFIAGAEKKAPKRGRKSAGKKVKKGARS